MLTEEEEEILDLVFSHYLQDSIFSSGPVTDHPYYKFLVCTAKARPNDMIPWLLERLPMDFDLATALYEVVGPKDSPAFPLEEAGHIEYLTNLWTQWGLTHGYIKA